MKACEKCVFGTGLHSKDCRIEHMQEVLRQMVYNAKVDKLLRPRS